MQFKSALIGLKKRIRKFRPFCHKQHPVPSTRQNSTSTGQKTFFSLDDISEQIVFTSLCKAYPVAREMEEVELVEWAEQAQLVEDRRPADELVHMWRFVNAQMFHYSKKYSPELAFRRSPFFISHLLRTIATERMPKDRLWVKVMNRVFQDLLRNVKVTN